MTENEIKASIIVYGNIVDKAESIIGEINTSMEALSEQLAKVVKMYDDASRSIVELASQLENQQHAAAIMKLMKNRQGTTS